MKCEKAVGGSNEKTEIDFSNNPIFSQLANWLESFSEEGVDSIVVDVMFGNRAGGGGEETAGEGAGPEATKESTKSGNVNVEQSCLSLSRICCWVRTRTVY